MQIGGKMVYLFLADGFEELEALTQVDLLRRAGIGIKTVSVTSSKTVTGAHKIATNADILFSESDYSDAELLFLPGGMPGTTNLSNHEGLCNLLLKKYESNVRIAAICAAPSILGKLGILDNKTATCYPGFEGKLGSANYVNKKVVTDGIVTTSCGVGGAIECALELIRLLKDGQTAKNILEGILY